MKPTTLCYPINKRQEVLLGRKKRGFGADKYNGFGGKIQEGESFRACAVREVQEEVALLVKEADLQAVALFDFVFPYAPELTHLGYVYTFDVYEGVPLESEEMEPQWFTVEEFPYDNMWKGDRTWVPLLWQGKKLKGKIVFGEDNDTVIDMQLEEVAHIFESEDIQAVEAWLYSGAISHMEEITSAPDA